ncbi:MAG TPA: 50S ribosomal protein L4 [Candidatus Methanoculleus thermohydrogenotrophicum]|jgi:large subunit ribosomal protein L4e|nr:50S ribosomal protein L4 [Candidatus Methanoculleus thermohydrogenotrophicum]NLM81713.1 50S ribosomal protein L4 [Candidatus Methanoculleus thermohydrogenotrophicum]HOB17853.1 50S ribosomal protein L4 [Candidatus Methanoculleus thermohydrogenotrophicum]HPZ37376.1 50S ribosomal protein L4 [Candidatus Methanoculleus thermohydrogenotrophicum]HQC91248.1 50S ribosomal protein L4 [Candidatus Methanoculleus thermohydrogenotrophicum]
MKAKVRTLTGEIAHEVDLPEIFNEEYRPDLIKRAVLAIQSTRFQPHGTDPYAGMRTSAESWGSGRGVAQVPRIKNSSRAARVPQATGGRTAHPPKVTKVLVKRINRKEKQKALRSAIAASTSPDLVRGRGHIFDGDLPLVLEDRFEEITRTGDVIATLSALGVYADVERAKTSRKVRAGRGTMRGRRYKQRKSVLIVTGNEPLRAARNLAGVDAVTVDQLNTELLAPGTQAGRLTIWTESAIRRLEEFS